jgi:hypothetical protein
MSGTPLAILLGTLLLFVAWGELAPRMAARSAERRKRALEELSRRLWGDEQVSPTRSLAERNRILFVELPGWEQRLDHRLEDGHGLELGSALEEPRPGRLAHNGPRSRFRTVRLLVTDELGERALEVVRRPGLRSPPLEVLDPSGSLVGTIARESRHRFVLRDGSGAAVGAITRRSRHHRVDYELSDPHGLELGVISDLPHLARRAPGAATLEPLVKALASALQPAEHVLELRESAEATVRSLALAAAASVYLYLQRPFQSAE